jgi:hypothetical protein
VKAIDELEKMAHVKTGDWTTLQRDLNDIEANFRNRYVLPDEPENKAHLQQERNSKQKIL